jgi:hypothetical protein
MAASGFVICKFTAFSPDIVVVEIERIGIGGGRRSFKTSYVWAKSLRPGNSTLVTVLKMRLNLWTIAFPAQSGHNFARAIILDFKIRVFSVISIVEQTFAIRNLPVHHAMWLGRAVSAYRTLNCAVVNRPAIGQERNF